MHKRIQELAEQAGMYVDLNGNPWPKWMSAEECEVAYAKFAELIVQECASLAKSKSEYIQSIGTDDRGDQIQLHSLAWQFEEFGYKIKKHFGVEE
jgi:hypothetical protein